MDDIVPSLLEAIQKDFRKKINDNETIRSVLALVHSGQATHLQSQAYAVEVGQLLSETLMAHLTTSTLPDGKMYFNIADRILSATLNEDFDLISELTAMIQTSLNQAAGFGIKGITASADQNRIKSFIEKLVSSDSFDDVAWILGEPIITFSQEAADETIKRNVEFQGASGIKARIIRRADSNPCDWCRALVGEYEYPDVPAEVYQKHDRCRCTVTYDPGEGTVRKVW